MQLEKSDQSTHKPPVPPLGFLYPNGLYVIAGALKKIMSAVKFAQLQTKLTVVNRPVVGPVQYTRLYEMKKIGGVSCIRLPRGMLTSLAKLGPIKIKLNFAPLAPRIEFPPAHLNDNQNLVCDALEANIFTPERIFTGTATTVLHQKAGTGKTFVATGMIARLGMPTMYVCMNEYTRDQAIADINFAMRVGDAGVAPIAVAYSKKLGIQICSGTIDAPKVLVIIINSALKLTPALISKYSFGVLDEIQEYCSEQRRKILSILTLPCIMGMSATPNEREDKLDVVYMRELGPLFVAENVADYRRDNVVFGGTVSVINYHGPPEFTRRLTHENGDKMFMPLMNKQFIADPYRMRLAITELTTLYNWVGDAGQQHVIYVFCEERDPLAELRCALSTALGVEQDGIDVPELGINTFMGGTKNVTGVAARSRILLATYGYACTGISINAATAILFLTSRKAKSKQTVARILRLHGDTSIHRRIIDIVDAKTAVRRQFEKRQIAYEFYKLDMEIRDVHWEELVE